MGKKNETKAGKGKTKAWRRGECTGEQNAEMLIKIIIDVRLKKEIKKNTWVEKNKRGKGVTKSDIAGRGKGLLVKKKVMVGNKMIKLIFVYFISIIGHLEQC